jgi:hypothetical protein
MASLTVTIAPASGVSLSANVGPFLVDVVFTRTLPAASGATKDLPATIQDTVRGSLDSQLRGLLGLPDVQPSSNIELSFLAGSGATRLKKTAPVGTGNALAVSLTAAEVAIVTAPDAQPAPSPPQAYRQGYFVQVSGTPVAFDTSKLQIAPVTLGDGGWSRLGLDKVFHSDTARTTSISWLPELLALTSAATWTSFHVAVDGQFTFVVNADSGDAWLWWLSGPNPAIGIVLDNLSVPRVARVAVVLPPAAPTGTSDTGSAGVPPVFTEAEVADNPHIYTEDPGSFCQPFKNPERVLGERSFFVIFRAEQPVISAEATVKKDPLSVLTSAVSPAAKEVLTSARTTTARTTTARNSRAAAAAAATAAATAVKSGELIAGSKDSLFERHTLPAAYLDLLTSFDRGRADASAKHPIQWESDTSRYQATTVARGHIIEIRMRWRSNGYSLGTVAKTLTLAPRQAKRIEKVEWRRTELSRRQETTRLADEVSDSVNQEHAYDDSVSANLSEWEKGSSSSKMASLAGGMGFVYAGFIAGGGHGASYSSSQSSQSGGRATSASEEQRVRDSIRRYGESLRKLDSLVVNEVTQEESVTGTTEVVRNANYAHSLTVIYYQILRHLKVETAVAGIRECLFVPFAISPFTVARAYRWREAIGKSLRDPQYGGAIKYLKDVLSNFLNSTIPAGRRSDQRVRFIHGSVFVRIAIDRPSNKSDGGFDVTKWLPLQPFLLTPALGIFGLLNGVSEAERDARFQREHAPGIAANWANTLLMKVGSKFIPADFTLATRYQFNGVVRLDFRAAIPESIWITREILASIQFLATKPLTPGSVANLQSLSFTYQTDTFQHAVAASEGQDDLILPETGAVDGGGAVVSCVPDIWERQDVRAEMILAVERLLEHLNEHVEYYHKAIWWSMDRDRLFMLIDGFYAPGTNQLSIASVVERDPIAIIGNAIVYRVSNGAFLGLGSIKTPEDLYNYYVAKQAVSEPMLISLPTDGLYAQTVMDDCPALEEHYGNTDWALNDPDLSLGEIAPELLASRRAEPQSATPTPFPQTLINLQNAPSVPAPNGLAGAFSAVSNPNAFRDMAGLAGTQANAATAFQAAADLAKNFGNQAAALKLAELAKDSHSTQTADQKLATVQRAQDKNLVTPEVAQDHAAKILDSLHAPDSTSAGEQRDAAVTHAVLAAADSGEPFTVEHATADGSTSVTLTKAGGVKPVVVPTWAQSIDLFPPKPVVDFETNNADMKTAFKDVTDHNPTNLCAALVDLTGAPIKPPYAGANDQDVLYPGSMGKICAMYGAFALKSRVQAFVDAADAAGASTAAADLLPIIKEAWRSKLKALFPDRPERLFQVVAGKVVMGKDIVMPDLSTIFDITAKKVTFKSDPSVTMAKMDDGRRLNSDGDFTAEFMALGKFNEWLTASLRWSSNAATSKVVDAIGYFYIMGALRDAGFFTATSATDGTGLWLSGDYQGHDWVDKLADKKTNAAGPQLTKRWAKIQLDEGRQRDRGNFTATAFETARFMTLLALDKLVDPDSSKTMRGLLSNSLDGIGSYIHDAFAGAGIDTSVISMSPKKGYGNDSFSHECGIVERTVGTKTVKYVLVGLGSAKAQGRADLSALFLRLDGAIVARNP